VSRYVNHHLSPDIIVFNIVHNDFDESILEYNSKGTYLLTVSLTEAGVIENTPVPNYSFLQYDWKKRFLFQSAFVRYFWFNVYEWKRFAAHNNWITAAYNANINVDTVSARQDAVRIATYYIIGQIRKENKDKRIIFVMDAPRVDIYSGKHMQSNVLFLHEMIEELCRYFQIELIDLTTPMANDYEENHKRFDSEIDRHWDEYGHAFVAKQVLKQINVVK
jgi:hypothetical protein